MGGSWNSALHLTQIYPILILGALVTSVLEALLFCVLPVVRAENISRNHFV